MKKEIFANRNDMDVSQFNEIITLIRETREQVFRLANTTLINFYWKVGAYISENIAKAEWGDGVVKQLSDHIASKSWIERVFR